MSSPTTVIHYMAALYIYLHCLRDLSIKELFTLSLFALQGHTVVFLSHGCRLGMIFDQQQLFDFNISGKVIQDENNHLKVDI